MKIMLSMPSTISSTVKETRAIQASGLVIHSMSAIMHVRAVTRRHTHSDARRGRRVQSISRLRKTQKSNAPNTSV